MQSFLYVAFSFYCLRYILMQSFSIFEPRKVHGYITSSLSFFEACKLLLCVKFFLGFWNMQDSLLHFFLVFGASKVLGYVSSFLPFYILHSYCDFSPCVCQHLNHEMLLILSVTGVIPADTQAEKLKSCVHNF